MNSRNTSATSRMISRTIRRNALRRPWPAAHVGRLAGISHRVFHDRLDNLPEDFQQPVEKVTDGAEKRSGARHRRRRAALHAVAASDESPVRGLGDGAIRSGIDRRGRGGYGVGEGASCAQAGASRNSATPRQAPHAMRMMRRSATAGPRRFRGIRCRNSATRRPPYQDPSGDTRHRHDRAHQRVMGESRPK